MDCSTAGAFPLFSEALAQRLVSVSADIADLRAWKQSVYLYERLVLPCAFIAELPQNLAPACIADLPCQIRVLLKHLSDIEAFCTDQVILLCQPKFEAHLTIQSPDALSDCATLSLFLSHFQALIDQLPFAIFHGSCFHTLSGLPAPYACTLWN